MNLRELNLSQAEDAWLPKTLAAALPRLECLDLTATSTEGPDLLALACPEALVELTLGGTCVATRELVHLQCLRRLDLWRGAVQDDDLPALSKLPKLTFLDLSDTPVGDDGLWHLRHLSQLRTLWIYKTKVTTEGVRRLQEAIPGLEVGQGRWRPQPATPQMDELG